MSSVGDAARFYEDIQRVLRANAILRIFINGDAQGFCHDLTLSAYARRSFLRWAHRDGYVGRRSGTSYRSGLVDAIAAGGFGLAKGIGALSRPSPLQGKEYADDFWYARTTQLLSSDAPKSEIEEALVSFGIALDGESSPRFDVCRSVVLRDEHGFEAAFEGLLRKRDEETALLRMRAAEDVVLALDAMLFVEGCALIRIAEHRSMDVPRVWRGCPILALQSEMEPAPDDEFPP